MPNGYKAPNPYKYSNFYFKYTKNPLLLSILSISFKFLTLYFSFKKSALKNNIILHNV